MKVVHYTRDKNFKLRPIKIEEGELPIKPKGGIWASPLDASFGWKDWCELAKFGNISSEYPVILDLDTTNFIVVDRGSDLDKLPWYKKFGVLESIDFKKLVNQGVDGIYLTSRGEAETRFTYPRTLYGWDCESVLILNKRCICDYWPKESEIRLDEIKGGRGKRGISA